MRKLTFFILILSLCVSAGAQSTVSVPDHIVQTVVHHKGYTVSFNEDARIPNYVSYTLRPEDVTTEGVSRNGEEFLPDPDIEGCPESRDYSRTGYDRGHMMPAADCKTDEVRMRESFYLSNVCPQNHSLNEGSWCDLEKQVRFWCKHYYKTELRIVCGPWWDDGCRITDSGIAVPQAFWKVICRYDSRQGHWKAIAFLFPNNASEKPYATRQVSVDDIESLTGMDFFTDIPDKEENAMEKSVEAWKF